MDLHSFFSEFAGNLNWMNLTTFSNSEHFVLLSQHVQSMKSSQPAFLTDVHTKWFTEAMEGDSAFSLS